MAPSTSRCTLVSACVAGLCLLGPATASSGPPHLVDCAIQFFATGMHGKGVRLQTTRDDAYAIDNYLPKVTTSAAFDKEKAVVNFKGAIDVDNPKKVDVHLHADFTANYPGCSFEDLSFGHIIDNHGSAGGSGNCYTIQQWCSNGDSVYGTVYVDLYCSMPYEEQSIKMKYSQSEPDVGEVLNC